MRRIIVVCGLLAAMLVPLVAAPAASAQSGERCFSETGYCISGPIRDYWERNGGLAVFGYPISTVAEESIFSTEILPNQPAESWRGPVQWFERTRLEIHAELGGIVLPGRIGAEQQSGFSAALVIPKPVAESPLPGCRYFPETQQNLCAPYLSYWEQNGGLARFGYPRTAPQPFTSGAWSGEVQWFERVRFELHNELPGAPILLGRLGSEQHRGEPSAVCATPVLEQFQEPLSSVVFRFPLGCPVATSRNVLAAWQYFEQGIMLWLELPRGATIERRIYVINTAQPLSYTVYPDTWTEGQPSSGNATPPPGLFEPIRGFGKLWRENPEVRTALGWATGPEGGDRATVQEFSGGALIWLEGSKFFFAFGPRTQVTAFSRGL